MYDITAETVSVWHLGRSWAACTGGSVHEAVHDHRSERMTPTTERYHAQCEIRRSVLEQTLRYGPLEARRTAFSVALAIFWRMRGEVKQPRTVAPGHDKMTEVCGVTPPTSKRFEPRRL